MVVSHLKECIHAIYTVAMYQTIINVPKGLIWVFSEFRPSLLITSVFIWLFYITRVGRMLCLAITMNL